MWISDALGGDISGTSQRIRKMQKENVLFVVDGRCASACTHVLDRDYPHVCWTDRAEFLFHGARRGGGEAPVGGSEIANALLAGKLPDYVRTQLPPHSQWSPNKWHSVKAGDLPASGHCRNSERFAALERDSEGNLVSRYEGPQVAQRSGYRDVSDDVFLQNVRKSMERHSDISERIREGAIKTRPHLEDRIRGLTEAAIYHNLYLK